MVQISWNLVTECMIVYPKDIHTYIVETYIKNFIAALLVIDMELARSIVHYVTYEWTFHPMVLMKENSLEFHATRQVNFTDCGLQNFKHIRVYLSILRFKIWEAEYLRKDALMG